MALFSERSWDDWVSEYELAHQDSRNKWCHRVGIPTILLSLLLIPIACFWALMWGVVATLFVLGWLLQFIGHYYEQKPPEFLRDWRFLFVGLRWWLRQF